MKALSIVRALSKIFLPLDAILFTTALAIVAFLVWPAAYQVVKPWFSPVVTAEEVIALKWASENLEPSLFAADLFACEAIVALTKSPCMIGGAWELADRPSERFLDNERLFLTNNATEAWTIAKKWRIRYIFAHPRTSFYGYGYKQPKLEKFHDARHYKPLYENQSVAIYEVMP